MIRSVRTEQTNDNGVDQMRGLAQLRDTIADYTVGLAIVVVMSTLARR